VQIYKAVHSSRKDDSFKSKGGVQCVKAKTSDSSVLCMGCGDVGVAEDWVKCNVCDKWWHESCSAYTGRSAFVCDLC
jgi:hypothetical protein